MELFNILKPDMIQDRDSLNFYLKNMKNCLDIEIKDMYYIHDWIKLAQLIYELDIQNTQVTFEKIVEKRKQLLVTLLGYNIYFNNQDAIVSLYQVPNNELDMLQKLNAFKKELRKIFVNQTDKYYIKILNESEIDYSKALKDIELSDITTEVTVVPYYVELPDSNLKMAFFNRLHFPNTNIDSVSRELSLLREQRILEDKNRVKELIL